ncbi:MAG TPA: ferredoxin [Tenuifilaceae bacterium]|nr:ferredoxin [Tenuifilaceae bacterium]HRX67191.1 ferredoxin [Tenuifilaceae bacterium]
MSASKPLEINLYRYKCIGCSYCVSIAPEVFAISHIDGKVTIPTELFCDDETQTFQTERIYLDSIKQAKNICPVQAIKVKL